MTPRKTAISIGEMRENEDESVDLDDLGTIFSDKAYGMSCHWSLSKSHEFTTSII
jgi:hypothetical protein